MSGKPFTRFQRRFWAAACGLALTLISTSCLAPTRAADTAPPPATGGVVTSYADTVARVAPSVVTVLSEKRVRPAQQFPFADDPMLRQFGFGGARPQAAPEIERGLGSGVIVTGDGTILTNHHVVDGAQDIRVQLSDHRAFPAKVIGSDPPSDLAVLKIDAKDLPTLALGDSDKVRVGDVALAIGNPLGLEQTVTAGIISAKGRATGLSDGSFEDFLQTDAPINQGNSGGALVNTDGQLIGINSQILSPSGGNIGIGFAIPSNMARNVMTQLLKDGQVHRGQLGVGVQNLTSDLAQTFGLKDMNGVLVNSVKPDSPAARAGLQQGDVIIALDGQPVSDTNVLRNHIAATQPGTAVTLTVLRNGHEQSIKATLGEYSVPKTKKDDENADDATEPTGVLGVSVTPLTPEIAKQIGVDANTGGLVVAAVDPSGPAAEAGLREGDVLEQVNRKAIRSVEDVKAALSAGGGQPVLVLINRRGQELYVTAHIKQ